MERNEKNEKKSTIGQRKMSSYHAVAMGALAGTVGNSEAGMSQRGELPYSLICIRGGHDLFSLANLEGSDSSKRCCQLVLAS